MNVHENRKCKERIGKHWSNIGSMSEDCQYRRLGGESNREIVSFRCVRAGEAKLRERVRASASLFARLENRISLAVPCRAVAPFVPAGVFIFL